MWVRAWVGVGGCQHRYPLAWRGHLGLSHDAADCVVATGEPDAGVVAALRHYRLPPLVAVVARSTLHVLFRCTGHSTYECKSAVSSRQTGARHAACNVWRAAHGREKRRKWWSKSSPSQEYRRRGRLLAGEIVAHAIYAHSRTHPHRARGVADLKAMRSHRIADDPSISIHA